MKKFLSILFTVLFLLLFSYYFLFFRFFNLSYTFESNKTFFKWLLSDPVTLVLGLTPGTDIYNTYKDFDISEQDSVFDTTVEETSPSNTSTTNDALTWPKYLSFSDSDQVYSDFYTQGVAAQTSSDGQVSSEEWNWETSMLSGDVVAKDSQKMLLGLEVYSPEYFVAQGNPHTFKIVCASETSVLMSASNLEVLEYDTDFFGKVDVGDTVYAYCTSSECIGLGRGCILMKAQTE